MMKILQLLCSRPHWMTLASNLLICLILGLHFSPQRGLLFASAMLVHISAKATYIALIPSNVHFLSFFFCEQLNFFHFLNTRFSSWGSRGASLHLSCWESEPKFSENQRSFSENLFFILPWTSRVSSREIYLSVFSTVRGLDSGTCPSDMRWLKTVL
jgi:hypothetical protein